MNADERNVDAINPNDVDEECAAPEDFPVENPEDEIVNG